MKINTSLFRTTARCCLLLVVLAAVSVRADEPDCAEPDGHFPTVAEGQGHLCAGVNRILKPGEYADPNNPVDDKIAYYRWHTEYTSACYNNIYIGYTHPDTWPTNPFVSPPPAAPPSTDPLCRPPHEYGYNIDAPYGFRAPLSHLAAPGLGDFLPPSPTLGGSSSPLVPSGQEGMSTWWNDATRQTLNETVDLVTGLPLARVNQLELPFDGATFRLIRTRSGTREDQRQIGTGRYDFTSGQDRWWDWSGQGWMINENPVLVIDSAVADLVGNNPRTTWLVLDAHHSIPFQFIESTGIYAAPPRFRAKLVHNGEWDPVARDWESGEEPTQMDVYLYDGALKYTFVVVREDMPQYRWLTSAALGSPGAEQSSSLDARPFLPEQFPSGPNYEGWDPFAHCQNPGLGLPYIGLCVKIEDQRDHVVEINYCGIEQRAVDYADSTSPPDTDGSDCVECGQSCASKGLIRSVKLKTRGETRWSLLYAYRGFRGGNVLVDPAFHQPQDPANEEFIFRDQDLWGSYHIDRIYVYKVDDSQPDPEDTLGTDYCLRVPHFVEVDLDGSSAYELADPLSNALGSSAGLADQWTHLVQNHFIRKPHDDINNDGIEDPVDPNTVNETNGVWRGAVKVMTSVTSRMDSDDDDTDLTETVKRWVYHHSALGSDNPDAGPRVDSGAEYKLRWLSRIYTPEDVSNVLSTEFSSGEALSLENLVYMTNLSGNALRDDVYLNSGASELRSVAQSASYQFGNGTQSNVYDPPDGSGIQWPNADGYSEAPNATTLLSSYLLNDADYLMTDSHADVIGSVVMPGEDGRKRYYRINRLRVSPVSLSAWDDPFLRVWDTTLEQNMNHRSAFVHPYQWHGYRPVEIDVGWADSSTSQSPELTSIRWITVIDEFADPRDLFPDEYEDAELDGFGDYTGGHAIKKTQLSRRVVELSPSGYLMRDRKWEFTPEGVVRSGGGLGEQYIYRTAEDYFADKGEPLPADTSGPTAGNYTGVSGSNANDALLSVRNELLKVEYRSVGWSAGELIGAPGGGNEGFEQTNGYTRFTEYSAIHPAGGGWGDYLNPGNTQGWTAPEIEASARIQPTAEGFHRGSDYEPADGGVGWDIIDDGTTTGNGLPRLYTSQVFRDPDNPNDVLAELEFVEKTTELELSIPIADYGNPDGPLTHFRIQREFIERKEHEVEDDGTTTPIPLEEQPITSRMIVGVPRQVYPDSPWYYPVEREFYDEDGNPIWACTGQLKDPEDPDFNTTDPYETLTFTYYDRDREGRSVNTVMDAATSGLSVSSSNVEDPELIQDEVDYSALIESGWERIGQYDPAAGLVAEPLNYVTSFVYDDYAPGLCDVYYPNGRRWARRVVILEDTVTSEDDDSQYNAYLDEYAREFIYNDLEFTGTNWVTKSEGEVKDYRSTDVFQPPLVNRKVRYVGGLPNDDGTLRVTKNQQPDWYLKAAIQLGVDSNGRIQKASLLERSPSGALLATGSKEINDLGELYREQEIDETITVQTRNSLGQTLRVYQGTDDRIWYMPQSEWYTGSPPPAVEFDMILLERTEYGLGVNDAWMPTVVRKYDKNPAWAADLHGEVTGDQDGVATVIGYDWQSRAVRTDTFERGDPFDGAGAPRRMTTSLVYLDYLDRPYLEVSYGADPVSGASGSALSIPSAIDPTEFIDADLFPGTGPGGYELWRFYEGVTGQQPLSVTESFYGVDGTLQERRMYDTAWDGTGDAPYLAEYMYNGRGGVQVFTQSPGGAVEVSRLDSLGRIKSTSSMVPSTDKLDGTNLPVDLKELTRTDFRYDTDGNVVDTAFWERVNDLGGDTLDSTNAVRTRSVSWYNAQKRLVATAEIGTEDDHGRYRYADEDYVHPVPGPGDAPGSYTIPHWNEGSNSVTLPENFPEHALVRVYDYDDDGNKVRSVDPNGIATEYEYTSTNRLMFKTENAADPLWSNRRMSGYRYEYGRLIEMNLVMEDNRITPVGGTAPIDLGDVEVTGTSAGLNMDLVLAHRTGLEYGGEIVHYLAGAGEYQVVSRNNKLIGSMHLPNEQTGDPNDDVDVFLRYTFSGQIAERYNGAGEAFRYVYDDLDRLVSVEVGHWDPADGYPTIFIPQQGTQTPGGLSTPEPTDKIGYIEYAYDDRGNVSDVHAWSEKDEAVRIQITHNRMEFERDRLVTEYQMHGEGVIDADTPRIDYAWQYEPTELGDAGGGSARTGHHRLASMEYPVPDASTNRRKLTMLYGLDATETDLLSRLTEMRSSIGSLRLAGFAYTGSGRRSALLLKNNKIANDHRDTVNVGLMGVDEFGRSAGTHFRATVGLQNTLYRAEYTFDGVGNRTSARIEQADVEGNSRDNIRSVVNSYDSLYRLVSSQVGEWELASNGDPQIVAGTEVHNDSWTLDLLGNWVGDIDPQSGVVNSYGRHTTGTLDGFGVPWSLSTQDQYTQYEFGVNQDVTQRDSIASYGLFEMYEADTSTEVTQNIEPVYDGAGRMLFDGQYGYQYDAWGRMVQINEATAEFDPGTGEQTGYTLGHMLKHYVYDGFGRLVRTSSPYPEPGTTTNETKSVNFYYDGARRIQEIASISTETYASAMASPDPTVANMAAGSTTSSNPEGSSTPMNLQKGLQGPVPLSRDIYREYVWGPGDNGFDEILLQTDENDDEFWCIQDGGGDLVALVTVTGNTVAVVRQWTYDAYGAILSAEHLDASIESHIGHKGLFLDRLDVAVGDETLPESPRLVPYAHAMYQNRNRSYSPSTGRFMQMDPNQTGMALMSVTASHGRGFGAINIAFSMEGMYGDGLNLYQYLGSNPWTNSDPLGLSSDPFAEIDAIINEYIGARVGILSGIGQEAKSTAVMAAHIASYLPFPGVGLVGDLALYAMGQMSMNEVIAGAALGIFPGGKLVKLFAKSGLGRAIGQIGQAAWKSAKNMASRGGAFLRNAASGLASRAKRFLDRKPKAAACGCFTAATMVWTANGAVPIVEIEEGQQVFAAAEDGESINFASSEVGTKILIGEASLVQLVVLHEDGSSEIINTTDEHPFHVADTVEWTRADQLRIGDRLSTISGVARLGGVLYTTDRVPVYNLSILGSPTYYVGEHGVWVHNCLPRGVPGAYREAKKTMQAMRKAGYDVEAHHVLEKRMLTHPHFNGLKADDMVGVVLERSMHQHITNALRAQFAYGTRYQDLTIGQIRDGYERAYQSVGRLDLFYSIEHYFR